MAGKQNPAVQEALRLIDEGLSPYAAAKKAGAVEASVYSALKRRLSGKKPAAESVGTSDPEAVLRQWIADGRSDEVALILGRLFLLLDESKRD